MLELGLQNPLDEKYVLGAILTTSMPCGKIGFFNSYAQALEHKAEMPGVIKTSVGILDPSHELFTVIARIAVTDSDPEVCIAAQNCVRLIASQHREWIDGGLIETYASAANAGIITNCGPLESLIHGTQRTLIVLLKERPDLLDTALDVVRTAANDRNWAVRVNAIGWLFPLMLKEFPHLQSMASEFERDPVEQWIQLKEPSPNAGPPMPKLTVVTAALLQLRS